MRTSGSKNAVTKQPIFLRVYHNLRYRKSPPFVAMKQPSEPVSAHTLSVRHVTNLIRAQRPDSPKLEVTKDLFEMARVADVKATHADNSVTDPLELDL